MNNSAEFYRPPVNQGLDVLYQDHALLVLNKPCSLLSVPGRGTARQDSLATRVQKEFPDAEVVHRLDMSTSGVMLMARGKAMQAQLSRLFQERRIEKRYIAVVTGKIKQSHGEIDLPLLCDWPNRPKQKVDSDNGKPALTRFQVLYYDSVNDTTRVVLTPVTGRSHQLRVHMQQLGHAILGDELYAGDVVAQQAKRLLLHAESIAFMHPVTAKKLLLGCEPPF
ncbi:MAG: bifunctional tRNA pseudouridine(32) synthase/23S rRNA pseudouridine(746) synthase RluA [Gammaproteobacteria bacterium]|nr:MAG: bifunctional tRNA pseudouridine(32) synthase/23S rRNA pseudouridine(746) synthase RluA [Gammaproteobacteria bacterium]